LYDVTPSREFHFKVMGIFVDAGTTGPVCAAAHDENNVRKINGASFIHLPIVGILEKNNASLRSPDLNRGVSI
jgi:hypothetical protein